MYLTYIFDHVFFAIYKYIQSESDGFEVRFKRQNWYKDILKISQNKIILYDILKISTSHS